jgi:hypothetical protein
VGGVRLGCSVLVVGLPLCCSVLVQTDGGTPLSIASDAGHVEVVRVLLGGGAAVNQGKVCCRVRYAVTSQWVHAVEGA